MTALELYKFITDHRIEWHYIDNNGEEDVLIFPEIYKASAFHALLSPAIFDDDGLWCVMKDGYFAIWMNQVCDHYGIELAEVFPPGSDGE